MDYELIWWIVAVILAALLMGYLILRVKREDNYIDDRTWR